MATGEEARPRGRLFQLRGEAQQDVFAAHVGDELDADGQAVRRPVQR